MSNFFRGMLEVTGVHDSSVIRRGKVTEVWVFIGPTYTYHFDHQMTSVWVLASPMEGIMMVVANDTAQPSI